MRGGGCAVVRRGHLIAGVSTFLIGCAVLLIVVGCAGVGSEAPQKEQTHSPQATASEEARCQGTSTTESPIGGPARFTTNDLPGCPKGGLILGTDKHDYLYGKDGDDVIRGLGAKDDLYGGSGNDKIYGGDGNDSLAAKDGQRDKLYCGKGKDEYFADKNDYVSSSCEKKVKPPPAPMA